jgi:hypothetical protein
VVQAWDIMDTVPIRRASYPPRNRGFGPCFLFLLNPWLYPVFTIRVLESRAEITKAVPAEPAGRSLMSKEQAIKSWPMD